MSCEKCDKEPILRAFYRWKTANVEIVACKEHWLEIREALNEAQEPNPDVSSEFPAEKECKCEARFNKTDDIIHNCSCGASIYNQARSQCLAVHQRLMAEKEQKVKELEIVLEAWHSIFGTTQLTHAQARLEFAETTLKRKEAEIVRLRKALSDIATGKHPQKRCMEIAERSLEGK